MASDAEERCANSHLTEAQRPSKMTSLTWGVLADEHGWSEEIRRIFGFDLDAEATMPMILAAVHPDDIAEVERVIGGALEGRDFDLVFRIDERVRLSVQDVGVGVDPQAIEKLFDAFHTTKADGMGAGLYISRAIIEGHEGRLWATANDGAGTTFSVFIPGAPRPASRPYSQSIRSALSNSDREHVARNP